METSERFYARAMAILGFRKGEGNIGGDPHLFYHNRQMVFSLRPAEEGTATLTRRGCTTSAFGWWTRPP